MELLIRADLNAASDLLSPAVFVHPNKTPFDNSQPFFHYVIGLLLWHSISQLRTAITTMHWETNGHLGGMPLQLYHLVTPGGHKRGMTALTLRTAAVRYGKEVNIGGRTLVEAHVWFACINNSDCQRRRRCCNSHKFSLSHRGHLLETCNSQFLLPGTHLFKKNSSKDYFKKSDKMTFELLIFGGFQLVLNEIKGWAVNHRRTLMWTYR